MSERERQLQAFLQQAGWAEAERAVLAADASFRRYDRLTGSAGRAVLMDAPPPKENVGAFHRVQSLLLAKGFSPPKALAVDQKAGFMLLEDLGDQTFTRALRNGADEASLYRLAIDVLIALHERFDGEDLTATLPPYDDERLLIEAALLTDWYLPAIGLVDTGSTRLDALRESYLTAWQAVLPQVRAVPESLVLRDYHVDNLMVLEGREDIAACGLLDFQDAVVGPITYDLASLLKDVRRDVDPTLIPELEARYLAGRPGTDPQAFSASAAILGAQRNAKIIGIFTRLCRRDGKPVYLKHINRTWRLLEGDLAHPALAPVKAWFDANLPADKRVVPTAQGGA